MDPRISRLIDSLPTLTKDDVDIHDYCPICFVDFKTILDDDDSESKGAEPAGITMLVGCSHVFCRKDLIQWIRSWHGSCPTCRNIFLSNLHPDSESDDEESDGGEYVPNDHDEFDEDFEEEEEEEEESFSFDAEPSGEFIGDADDHASVELSVEEDDHAMGLGVMDLEFEDYDNDGLLMAAANEEAYAEVEVEAAEDIVARIEAELQDDGEGFGAELFSLEDALAEQEEEWRRLEAEFEEDEECTDLPNWDDSEDLRFSVADSFQPENEALEEDIEEEVGSDVEAYEEFDQR